MATKKIEAQIAGVTPLLMHRFPLEEIEAIEKKSKEEQAEIAAYRDADGQLYIPGINIQRALISGATYVKGKGRASLQKPVAACVFISPEIVSLGTDAYTIDTRPVVIRSTQGRILRHRPRLDKWGCTFFIEFDDTLLTETQLRRVVDSSLDRVGLLDFRPERKGPFGRAMVVKWK